MPSLTDTKFQVLRNLGFTGSMSDMLLQWLQSKGATAKTIPDAWEQFLLNAVTVPPNVTPSSRYSKNDWWYAYLEQEGFDQGHINDRELAFWLSQITPPPTGGGFSDGFSDGFDV